jgi:excisionase family DNA binding protein
MQKIPNRVRRQSDKNNNGDNYISMPEACRILFLSDSTIRYYIGRHRIKAFKSGGKWYVFKDDILTFKQWYSAKAIKRY